jgi:hypothetical protein
MQNVSPNAFVLRPLEEAPRVDAMRDKLAPLGNVESSPTGPAQFLVRVQEEGASPKDVWRQLRERVGSEFAVDPVFVDDQGNLSYSTGAIAVRFRTPPTEQQLSHCRAKFGLALKNRNKYVPTQFVFEPLSNDDRFLPDVLEALRQDEPEIQTAWAETKSQFERAT